MSLRPNTTAAVETGPPPRKPASALSGLLWRPGRPILPVEEIREIAAVGWSSRQRATPRT